MNTSTRARTRIVRSSSPARPSLSRFIAICLAFSVAGAAHAQPITETIPGTTVKLSFVPIPAGKVSVPDPTDPAKSRDVDIKPFYLSTTEVTFDAYDIFVYRLDETDPVPDADATTKPSKPYIPPDRGFGHAGYAAIGMSFKGADEFCKWLSKKTGHTYRLATEAEWEHAARAGDPHGVAADALADFAWFKDNAGEKTHPVASKKPNAWGLFDMLGNAAEWVVGHDGKPVTKGGSFKDAASELEVSDRMKQSPAWNASDPQIPKSKWWLSDCSFVGFRIVRELKPGEPAPSPARTASPTQAHPDSNTPPATPKDRIDDHPAPPAPR
ncbi:MAG: SUMF1/EgtB/PvdO family nonheme iron enzyme [Phycisphaeraceae bacterium]|nr:SUMF1/EgtB/PvdO family nonheme iron enzyme [Phycisphaeraceae bacterium]